MGLDGKWKFNAADLFMAICDKFKFEDLDSIQTQMTSSRLSLNNTFLNEEETLVNVLRAVIPAYAKADAENKLTTQINSSDNIKSRLLETSLRELARSLNNQNVQLDISYNLAKEGFEYKIEGSTVEVSTDSVTSLLAEMIDPGLQQFLEKAANSESNE